MRIHRFLSYILIQISLAWLPIRREEKKISYATYAIMRVLLKYRVILRYSAFRIYRFWAKFWKLNQSLNRWRVDCLIVSKDKHANCLSIGRWILDPNFSIFFKKRKNKKTLLGIWPIEKQAACRWSKGEPVEETVQWSMPDRSRTVVKLIYFKILKK